MATGVLRQLKLTAIDNAASETTRQALAFRC